MPLLVAVRIVLGAMPLLRNDKDSFSVRVRYPVELLLHRVRKYSTLVCCDDFVEPGDVTYCED